MPWRDYAVVADVILTSYDTSVTTVNLANATTVQTAQSSRVSDTDGSRQVTALFAPGTTATMNKKTGGTQSLPALHVRMTEYTVGDEGLRAMPGPLPAASAYTYAVELSVDEAIADGRKVAGKDVLFNQPVRVFIDNFLDFPVGEPVPVGYYDSARAAWIAADSGKVIAVLGVDSAGRAQVDLTGSGTPAAAAALDAIGLNADILTALAATHPAPTSLWYAQLTHFSTWDINWGELWVDGSEAPNQRDAGQNDETPPDPPTKCNSIVECEGQVLGEQLTLVGSPLTLNYRSARTPGYQAGYHIDIPLTDATPPAPLLSILLEVDIAGRRFNWSFAPGANLTHPFIWDGKDAYGRIVQGTQMAQINIGYVYGAQYGTTPRFGEPPTGPMTATRGTRT